MMDRTAVTATKAPLETFIDTVRGFPDEMGNPTGPVIDVELTGVIPHFTAPGTPGDIHADPPTEGTPPTVGEYRVGIRGDADLPEVADVTIRVKAAGDPGFPGGPTPPAPFVFPPLEPFQFWAMIDILEKKDAIYAAIGAIPDKTQRAVVKAKLERMERFDRDDPLFAQLAPAVGLASDEIDAAWIQAAAIQ
jgi:hypothetical protein